MSDDPDAPRPRAKPFLLELDDAAELDPAAAPDVPELTAQGQAMQGVALLATRRRSGLGRAASWIFGLLFTFVLSVAAWDFVSSLFLRNPLLGWIAFVLVGLGVAFALMLALREAMGFARLARLDQLRAQAQSAHATADLKAARHVTDALRGLYGQRADAAWGVARFDDSRAEVLDADALLALAEAEILAPLDARARAEIEASARKVAMVTAIVPLALADVAVALYANMAMIRRVAEIYGGRSGTLGSWRLLRKVFAALLGAGAVALADDLVGSVAGGGVLSKLSRRLGEGVVNGALTARVGIAAMELCRPLPFRALPRPAVSGLLSRALAGLMPRGTG